MENLQMPCQLITYGTFDLFHRGHLMLLQRMSRMGNHITVGLSTGAFNAIKAKKAVDSYERRAQNLLQSGLVNRVIPENTWEQKKEDIIRYNIDILVMGGDWTGRFNDLKTYCKVCYLPRTAGISSTMLRELWQS
jgi:glycerol-3-phosphate cytidylyltransferase